MHTLTSRNFIAFSSLLLTLVLGCGALSVFAQLQGGFNPDLRDGHYTNREAHSIVVQADGKVVVATDKLQRFNPDGTKHDVISTLPGMVLEQQSDGKILYGLQYNTTTQLKRVVRLNADGSVDNSFDCPKDPAIGFGKIVAIAIAPDGDIYIADLILNQSVRIHRLNPDGSIDAAFNTVLVTGSADFTNTLVETMLVQPDGKLVVGGGLDGSNLAVFDIFRTNLDGTRDDSFVPPNFGNGIIRSISRQADGRLIVGGNFSVSDGQSSRLGLVRLEANGSLDQGFFQTGIVARVTAVLPDGRIFAGPASVSETVGSNTVTVTKMLRLLDQNGQPISNFGGIRNSGGSLNKIVVLPDGSVYLAGQSLRFETADNLSVVRLKANGRPDTPGPGFDYDGDGVADYTVYRPSNRLWYTQTLSNFTFFEFGLSTDRPVPADYDGDGKTDIAVWRPENGTWYWINSSNITFSTVQWGVEGDTPIGGNVAWDRKAPFTIYRPSNGNWYRLEGGNYHINVLQFGEAGDVPLYGRYIRDSEPFQSTPALYRPSSSTFILRTWRVGGGSLEQIQWGQPGDVPVCGDFDGDRLTDLAVYRPSNGRWQIRLSGIGFPLPATLIRNWGQPGDIPAVADYNGDFRDDVAVFRPSTGEWYVAISGSGDAPAEVRIRSFGVNGDRPAQGAYVFGLPTP